LPHAGFPKPDTFYYKFPDFPLEYPMYLLIFKNWIKPSADCIHPPFILIQLFLIFELTHTNFYS